MIEKGKVIEIDDMEVIDITTETDFLRNVRSTRERLTLYVTGYSKVYDLYYTCEFDTQEINAIFGTFAHLALAKCMNITRTSNTNGKRTISKRSKSFADMITMDVDDFIQLRVKTTIGYKSNCSFYYCKESVYAPKIIQTEFGERLARTRETHIATVYMKFSPEMQLKLIDELIRLLSLRRNLVIEEISNEFKF